MRIYHEFMCPSCGAMLRLNMNPSWNVGKVRCPNCMDRVTVKLNEKTRKKKNEK